MPGCYHEFWNSMIWAHKAACGQALGIRMGSRAGRYCGLYALTCTLKVHLCHQCLEGSLGRQPAGSSDRRLVREQVDGGESFLPRCEVSDVKGEGIPLPILQCPLPQDQVHSCVTSGGCPFVQDEGLVFKAVRCPSLSG